MLLFHIHCGAKRVSFKEASHFSLLSTLWGHLSLAYTVGTKPRYYNTDTRKKERGLLVRRATTI